MMKLKTKFAWISISSIVVTLMLAAIVIFQSKQLITHLEAFRATSAVAEKYVLMINRDMNYGSRLTRSIMLGDDFNKNFNKLESRIDDINQHFELLVKTLSQIKTGGHLSATAEQAKKDALAFLADGRARMKALEPNHDSADARAATWQKYKKEASPIANRARSSFRDLQDQLSTSININASNMDKAVDDTRSLSLIIIAGVILIIIIAVLNASLIKSMISRLYTVSKAMSDIGQESNLSARVVVENNDELSETSKIFNGMLSQFQQSIGQVGQSAKEVGQASKRLDQLSSEGLHNQQQQMEGISVVVDAMDTMCAQVVDVSNEAKQAADLAEVAQKHSNQGIKLSNEAVNLMENLAGQTGQANDVVKQLNLSCNDIASVLNVIQEVSEQTNLLALNAAIEAARAGEQGRGFAVVADEVRTLAIRSKDSTNEIQNIIQKLMERSQNAVATMERNQELANKSVSTTEAVLESMDKVVDAIDNIHQTSVTIANSATEQNRVAVNINETVISLQSIGQNSHQSAREVETSSSELAGLFDRLHSVIGKFQY